MTSRAQGNPVGRFFQPRRRPAKKPQTLGGAVTETIVVLATAMVLSLLLKTFLVQAFSIPSESMEDTLLIGDRVLVSKLTPGPFELHRGDVVVFKDPGGWLGSGAATGPVNPMVKALTFVGLLPEDYGEHLIKRIIGVPGDTITCCDAAGHLTVNGVAITESYVRTGNVPSEEKFSATVKADNLWVMGDNRSGSADSRSHTYINDGQVPIEEVVGKAFVVAWPVNRLGRLNDHHEVFATVPSRAPTSG